MKAKFAPPKPLPPISDEPRVHARTTAYLIPDQVTQRLRRVLVEEINDGDPENIWYTSIQVFKPFDASWVAEANSLRGHGYGEAAGRKAMERVKQIIKTETRRDPKCEPNK